MTPGALTREQVEEVFNAVYWHGDQQGAKQCKVLDGIDALRATIEQQAQELERLEGVCKERLEQGQQLHDQLRQLHDQLAAMTTERDDWQKIATGWADAAKLSEQPDDFYKGYSEKTMNAMQALLTQARTELAASQARCREMEREIESLTTCGCEGCDDNLEESAFCLPCMNKVQQQVTQLQTTLTAREARIAELEDWQKIVLGSGTEQETVIRMAANEYTKTAVQCWKDHTKKIEAERDAAVQEAERLREALRYYAQTAIGARAIAALKAQQAAGDSPAGQTPPNFREAP